MSARDVEADAETLIAAARTHRRSVEGSRVYHNLASAVANGKHCADWLESDDVEAAVWHARQAARSAIFAVPELGR